MSLAQQPITTILPVSDPTRAADFYHRALGLPLLGEDPEGKPLLGLAGGATLALMPAQAGAQTEHTVLSFAVGDIEDRVSELEAEGVPFLDYDLPDLHTVDHVWVLGSQKAAWFTDPDGNILCLHQDG
jgi:catechol 2,3-dioxygenase-like lactoylglutathione lyase family enzyme